MKVREFKSLQIVKIHEIERKLKEKYPEKASRVDEIVTHLLSKVYDLRVFTLSDYLFTIMLASREFSEFRELMPSEETVKELLKEE